MEWNDPRFPRWNDATNSSQPETFSKQQIASDCWWYILITIICNEHLSWFMLFLSPESVETKSQKVDENEVPIKPREKRSVVCSTYLLRIRIVYRNMKPLNKIDWYCLAVPSVCIKRRVVDRRSERSSSSRLGPRHCRLRLWNCPSRRKIFYRTA